MEKRKKILEGQVLSNKMKNTVVVQVAMSIRHPLYKKGVKKQTKIKAHSLLQNIQIGDKVRIIENKPISKEKRFRVVEVIK